MFSYCLNEIWLERIKIIMMFKMDSQTSKMGIQRKIRCCLHFNVDEQDIQDSVMATIKAKCFKSLNIIMSAS